MPKNTNNFQIKLLVKINLKKKFVKFIFFVLFNLVNFNFLIFKVELIKLNKVTNFFFLYSRTFLIFCIKLKTKMFNWLTYNYGNTISSLNLSSKLE